LIPLRDNNPTRSFPLICVLIIAVNVAVFLWDQLHPVLVRDIVWTRYGPRAIQMPIGELSLHYAMIPALVTGQGSENVRLPIDVQPAWLTIFTSMFLHANWLHIGGNMLYLWVFGNNIEDVLGKGRFVLFYLLSGLGAAAVHIASDPGSTIPTVGASGAIAGLMGAYLLLYPGTQILCLVPIFFFGMFFDLPAILVIGQWFALQFINAQWLGSGEMLRGGGVAYLAHIGGFLTGLLLIVLFGGRGLLRPPPARRGFDEDFLPLR
jgi:membrane associated rhomboid family serine protease